MGVTLKNIIKGIPGSPASASHADEVHVWTTADHEPLTITDTYLLADVCRNQNKQSGDQPSWARISSAISALE
jgi:hypothetical protein